MPPGLCAHGYLVADTSQTCELLVVDGIETRTHRLVISP
jgi:hypothetical protein